MIALCVRAVTTLCLCLVTAAAAGVVPTAQPTPITAAAKQTKPPRCGDGLLQDGESCTTCPQDCAPHACTPSKRPHRVRVELTPLTGHDVSTAMLRVSYRNATLSLPGQGTEPSVRERVKGAIDGASLTVNDLGYALRLVVSKVSLAPGPVADVTFDVCQGAAAPTADDVACTVEASAGIGGPVSGASCQVVTL